MLSGIVALQAAGATARLHAQATAPSDAERRFTQAPTAGRLDVCPIPLALVIGHADEWLAREARPVKAIATESEADVVRLLAIRPLAAVQREESEQAGATQGQAETVKGSADRGHGRPKPNRVRH